MINGEKILAIVPARGGSKRLPRKNLLSLAGKPLILWSLEAGIKSKYIDKLVVTSDDPETIKSDFNEFINITDTQHVLGLGV